MDKYIGRIYKHINPYGTVSTLVFKVIKEAYQDILGYECVLFYAKDSSLQKGDRVYRNWDELDRFEEITEEIALAYLI
ncbi:MAG: hypothetical protein IMZ52_02360 [Actinobacteria bacterium]|nr:hypothetical protein [Actinomycetota bacterium]MBE3114866.1 hypothetical protein [Actinomycetota bacterium]